MCTDADRGTWIKLTLIIIINYYNMVLYQLNDNPEQRQLSWTIHSLPSASPLSPPRVTGRVTHRALVTVKRTIEYVGTL